MSDMKNSTLIKKCFITGYDCHKKISIRDNRVFVAMPFAEHKDAYKYGIKRALENLNMETWRADERITNSSILCKICHAIQGSTYAIIDISKWNPNVLLEAGIAYGLGRVVLLIKDKKAKVPSDLRGIEYADFDSADELYQKLIKWFNSVKSETYENDPYLAGYGYRVKTMELNLDVNECGDAATTYNITIQRISAGQTEVKELDINRFVMPYHDSLTGVSLQDFRLDAVTDAGESLEIEWIIASETLKRFNLILPQDFGFEEEKNVNISMFEPRLFDREEEFDYYDLNFFQPTEDAVVRILLPIHWKVSSVWVSYGESARPVRTELQKISKRSLKHRQLICLQLRRPKIGLTYLLRWKWKR